MPVDDSYDTLVGRVKTQGPSVPQRVAGKAPDVRRLRQGLPLRAKSIRARDGMTAFARIPVLPEAILVGALSAQSGRSSRPIQRPKRGQAVIADRAD